MDFSFSWTDTARATIHSCFSSCFPASSDSDTEERYENPHQALTHNADLDRLLTASTSDSETDALSLHSNFGPLSRRKRRRNRRGKRKTITLFGFSLFGRPSQPIRLPDDDEDAAPLGSSRINSAPSTSTLDSDAAQLSATSLEAMSPQALEERAAQAVKEEQERREREEERKRERQSRRQERKQMKRMAASLASADGDFEGFQGSGIMYTDGHRNIPSPFRQTSSQFSGSDSGSVPSSPFTPYARPPAAGDMDEDTADLDGAMYSSRPRARGLRGDNSSGSGSRSRTSLSQSQNSPIGPLLKSPLSHDISVSLPSPDSLAPRKKTKKKSHKSSGKSASSRSTATSASSDPPQPPSPLSLPQATAHIINDFDGTPGGFDAQALHQMSSSELMHTHSASGTHGMPSPGLSDNREKRGLNAKAAGAFLNEGGGL